uniref:Uncharacterized protein n=1 Tax=Eucampia antarctica TaxID=49252 RepID=A0A7S2SD42_9STRA|eukprot:CAMPEP_0197831280 /NCGR_PEP_ID=MMETSP1437-20131217/8933_1 /TAXON_ID=49252 ORGANISM="Eucampia antarctica, Strain CCMP1452" /NCGR_SAMPLE_ID=MMETSP1437 /ASSEMBLY_ACC=CAM_ASM_001096 /LENGTH=434 /DNA_ID=CAMNT_0043434135 /DNA_START=33 /DNA_END=1337 /DNA_ORIENTATION=+
MFQLTTVLLAALAASSFAFPFKAAQSANNGKAEMMSNLMSKATPTKNSQIRRLDDGDDEYEVDLSGYTLKFMKCQFVKAYDDDLAQEEDIDTVLGTKRFVIFRLCPEGSCNNCISGYGEYLAPMDDYLEAVVEYRTDEQEAYCEACEETCEAEEEDAEEDADEDEDERLLKKAQGGKRKLQDDCTTCTDICEKIENMEDNYYIDATEFLACQQIYDGGDDDNADANALYAGPMCASSGQKIKIGVFTDEDCMFIDENKDVENYLADDDGVQMKLSHALLKTVYDMDDCISCLVPAEEDEDADDGDDQDEDAEEEEKEVQEVCQNLYEASGKCESSHGFDNGVEGDDYANQMQNEEIVCDFIKSIKSGTYSQSGEIVVGGGNSYANGGSTSGGQKFALTFFILGTVGLAVYAAMLHTNLTKNSKADLSAQGGAMA